jgi:hypothetical protein
MGEEKTSGKKKDGGKSAYLVSEEYKRNAVS